MRTSLLTLASLISMVILLVTPSTGDVVAAPAALQGPTTNVLPPWAQLSGLNNEPPASPPAESLRSTPGQDDPPAEIEPQVLEELAATGKTDVVVIMEEKADLSAAFKIEDWSERGRYTYNALREVANRTQAPVIQYAKEEGLTYQSFLTTNAVHVQGGDLLAVQDLASLPGVTLVRRPKIAHIHPSREESPVMPDAYGWNLDTLDPANNLYGMQAAQVWDQYSVEGDGIVVASIDTGAFFRHEALVNQYRGNLGGGAFDHNHNWYQPNLIPCGDGTYPCDADGHGSGTIGIMVGRTADFNQQIGVAPEAQWLACQGCDDPPNCTEAALTGCADWMLAPCAIGDDPGDPSCDPDMRPHVLNNSWGAPEGCDTWYQDYVRAWVSAGIFPAFSAGNTEACNSLGSPGDYPESFGTAAHDNTGRNLYAGGPSCFFPNPSCDPGAHEVAPHLNAPTFGYTTGNGPGEYYFLSGTSGASPHTAGAVALIWSANPHVVGQIDDTFTVLEQSANHMVPEGSCGKPACAGADPYPNYEYGWGYLDALAAVEHVMRFADTGILAGTVTDGASNPVSDATVQATLSPTMTWSTTSDASGDYAMAILSGTYTVDAQAYGYLPTQIANVSVISGTTTTLDIALTPADHHAVSGTVTAATGWPLYAGVDVDGYPGDPIWSDPVTGYYSVTLPEGISYTLNVSAWVDGYHVSSRDLGPLTGNETHDVELQPDLGACTAPNYRLNRTLLLSEDFDAGVPGSWTVVDHLGNGCVWRDDDPGGRGNLTGGSGIFAIADSDMCDPMNTELQTPAFDATGYTGLQIAYRNDYNDLGSTAHVDVYDGDTWTTIDDLSGVSSRGPETRVVNTAAGAGSAHARISWHYAAGYDWWWEVDEIRIYGTTCTPQAGGLVVGNVYDQRTNAPLVGAAVSNEDGLLAISEATPDDPAVDDGFYTVFSLQGSKILTATMANYGADTDSVNVVRNAAVWHDFDLPAGWLSHTPPALEATLDMGLSTTLPLTMSNPGSATVAFEFVEKDKGFEPDHLPGVKIADYQAPKLEAGETASTYAGQHLISRESRSYQPSEDAHIRSVSVDVLLVAAADVTQIKSMLEAYPDISAVDTFDANLTTPSLGQLLPYDTLIVMSDAPFANPTAMGDVLADYVDAGGTVIQSVPTFHDTGQGWALEGRFVDEGYSPFIGSGEWFTWAGLGSFDATHPIMQGVTAASDQLRQMVDLTDGADLVAEWTDDAFVATKGQVVALNAFLSDGYSWTGDVDLIVHNSIIWLQAADDVAWLSEDPTSGEVAAGDQQVVSTIFDAGASSVGQPGQYRGLLWVDADSPYEAPNIPVTMTVNAPATWGKLEGTVTGLGHCDADPAPLQGAEVLIESGMTETITVTLPITASLEDFEADDGGYTISGTTSWAWGPPTSGPAAAHSGVNVWATNLSGFYSNYEDGTIASPAIDLGAFAGQSLTLAWWQYYDGEDCCDTISVELSDDGGATWSAPVYGPFDGGDVHEQVWERQTVTLSPSYAVDDFRVRFRFISDYSLTYPGWYVDDVSIVGYDEAQADVPVSRLLESDENGRYERWIDEAHSPLTVTVTYPDHQTSQVAGVTVAGQATTTHNVSLRLLEPCVDVTPTSLSATIDMGASTTLPMSIGNQGAASFEFALWELGYGFEPAGGPLVIDVPAGEPTSVGEAASHRPAGEDAATRRRYTIEGPHLLAGPAIDVLLVHADLYPTQLKAFLEGYPDISTADTWNASVDGGSIPAPSDLLPYDVVIAWNNAVWADPDLIGDVLADYHDAGGNVILAVDAWSAGDFRTGGRFIDEAYTPFLSLGGAVFNDVTLGWYDAGHPLMDGIATSAAHFHNQVALSSAAVPVAAWDDGMPFVATKMTGDHAAVGINTYYGDGDVSWTTDAPLIVHNAIVYLVSGSGEVAWLSENPATGTVPADGGLVPVDVTLDAAQVAQPGQYHAKLNVNNHIVIPVTMTVNAPATWGKLEGTVTGLGHCDADPAPLQGAEVLIESGMTETITVTLPITASLEDFEADDGGYTISGTTSWAWGPPTSGPAAAHSGVNVWATNLSGFYSNYEDGTIASPAIDLGAFAGQSLTLAWWQYYDGEDCCDTISVELSDDGGATWSAPVYGPFDGGDVHEQVWERQTVTLSPSYAVDDFRVRFRFISDYSLTYPGWYVDDVSIVGYDEAQADVPVSRLLESDENGRYERWIDEAHSPLTVTVTYPDHQTSQVAGVTVAGQATTTEDLDLRRLEPCMGVSPLSMETIVAPGHASTVPLTLVNSGAMPSAFRLHERDRGSTAHAPAPPAAAHVTRVDEDKQRSPGRAGIGPADSGGPDPFGYTFVDSRQPSGLAFDWIEIAPPAGGSGTPVDLSDLDDGYAFPITIPFPFPFYGVDHTELAVGSNGTVYFEDAYLGLENVPIPGPNTYEVDTFIAHFWDDLVVDGDVYYQEVGDMLVIEYRGVRLYDGAASGTWEVILYDNGNILMQYLDAAVSDGSGATFGIQRDETTGLQYAYDAPAVSDGLAVCFIHPGEPLCGEGDDLPWLSIDPISGTVGADSTFVVDVTFDTLTHTLGTYTTTLVVNTDDPVNERIDVPATMTIGHSATYLPLVLRNH